MTVGQSLTHCRRYDEREDVFSELYALPKREFLDAHQASCQLAHVGVRLCFFFVDFMFSRGLEASSLIQFSHWVRVRPLFLCCLRKSSCWSPLHSSFFSELNNSWEQHVFCYFNVECEVGARQRGANQWQCNGKPRWRRPGHWRQDRHSDERAPLLALRSPSSSLLVPQPQHLQYGRVGRLNISFHDLERAEASSILQRGCWRGKLWRRVWSRHRCLSRTLPLARVGVQPTPAAAATNQLHFSDSSQLVRRKDRSSMRSGSSPGCRDYGCGWWLDSVRVSRVSRQQIVLVRALVFESDALEKGEGAGQRMHAVAKMQTIAS